MPGLGVRVGEWFPVPWWPGVPLAGVEEIRRASLRGCVVWCMLLGPRTANAPRVGVVAPVRPGPAAGPVWVVAGVGCGGGLRTGEWTRATIMARLGCGWLFVLRFSNMGRPRCGGVPGVRSFVSCRPRALVGVGLMCVMI